MTVFLRRKDSTKLKPIHNMNSMKKNKPLHNIQCLFILVVNFKNEYGPQTKTCSANGDIQMMHFGKLMRNDLGLVEFFTN